MDLRVSAVARGFGGVARAFARAFPTPQLMLPPAAGVDISNSAIKWIELRRQGGGLEVERFGIEPLPSGAVEGGVVKDMDALSKALAALRARIGGSVFAHAALPEGITYVFEMKVPEGTPHDQILRLIEFEFEGRVPITPDNAVFDFDTFGSRSGMQEIGVTVFPRELAEKRAAVFERAGITLLSLELDARAIARAILPPDPPVTLLVDFGHTRTGFAVLQHGVPIFTSTVDIGGDAITRVLKEKLSLTEEAAIAYRNDEGLVPTGGMQSPGMEAVAPVAAALSDEVVRHYRYWDTRRDEEGGRMSPISQVVLVGGSANLKGLTDYIAGRVRAKALLGNAWQRVYTDSSSTPPIDRRASLQYCIAVGLALRTHIA